jgi:hypothetical protein
LFPSKRIVLGIHLVREWDLFLVVGRKESDLRETVRGASVRGASVKDARKSFTLASIPASARAVYAPLENPNIQILSPDWSKIKMEEVSYGVRDPPEVILTVLH